MNTTLIDLRCPHCGNASNVTLATISFGCEVRCDYCGAASVLVSGNRLHARAAGQLICVECGEISPNKAKYCQCGEKLHQVCGCCGKEFPRADSRCMFCGLLRGQIEVGKNYTGTIISTTAFGAFMELLPGTVGLIHISELAEGRIESVEDVVKKGDVTIAKFMGIGEKGRLKLSCRAVLRERKLQE